MLPSSRLAILVLVAVPLFLAGAVVDALVAVGVIYLTVLVLYAGVDMLILPGAGQVEVVRSVPGRLSLGKDESVRVSITNNSLRPLTVWVAEDVPEHMEAEPRTRRCDVPAGETRSVDYSLSADRRGEYALPGLDVRVLPRRGLFLRQFRAAQGEEVRVFPNFANLERHELLVRRGMEQSGMARVRRLGQGTEFESLRPYVRGDDMRKVDWKATARQGRLIVRHYQAEERQNILAAIDASRTTAGEFGDMERLDYYVNAALMLSYVALRQGDRFSLLVFSDEIDRYVPARRRAASVERVARALYDVKSKSVEANYSKACRFLALKNRKRSLICLMTDVTDRESNAPMIRYLQQFTGRHLPLLVTLRDPDVAGVAEGPLSACENIYDKAAALDMQKARKEALRAMRSSGVDVLDAHPDVVLLRLIDRYLDIKATRRL